MKHVPQKRQIPGVMIKKERRDYQGNADFPRFLKLVQDESFADTHLFEI